MKLSIVTDDRKQHGIILVRRWLLFVWMIPFLQQQILWILPSSDGGNICTSGSVPGVNAFPISSVVPTTATTTLATTFSGRFPCTPWNPFHPPYPYDAPFPVRPAWTLPYGTFMTQLYEQKPQPSNWNHPIIEPNNHTINGNDDDDDNHNENDDVAMAAAAATTTTTTATIATTELWTPSANVADAVAATNPTTMSTKGRMDTTTSTTTASIDTKIHDDDENDDRLSLSLLPENDTNVVEEEEEDDVRYMKMAIELAQLEYVEVAV
jgi:hypothetical protein